MTQSCWVCSGFTACALFAVGAMPAVAGPVLQLQQYSVYIDGTIYDPVYAGDTLPANVDVSAFDTATGLGTIGITIGGTGSHKVGVYVDLDIDSDINGFSNEFGSTVSGPAAGESWEIDQPGFPSGDVYDNFLAGSLDNTNAVSDGPPNDVAMALMRQVTLAATDTAMIC